MTATHNDQPAPVSKPFFTFGTMTLLLFMGIGFSFGLTRLFFGLGNVTNLDDHNPWGIWIAFDVACGVALAAGGFTTAALVDIFGRKKYHALLRPAILTAFLGYLWVAIALSFDLGRYWNIWRPIFNWQGNSVLFEVGMCVTFYLMVLSVEMSPPVLEGLKSMMKKEGWGAALLRRVEGPVQWLSAAVRVVLPLFIVAGVVLSFMHQSSLGTLMLISPTKLSALWNTPILPILFLLSAIMVGFPMVILESVYANISFGRDPEMDLLTPLARIIPWFLGLYGIVKIGDLIVRWGQISLVESPAATISLVVEILAGVVAPFLLFLNRAVRRSMGWLFFTVALIIFGVILNRINVFLVGYSAPYSTQTYFPSIGEIAMTIAIVSSILFCYRLFVTFFPILPGYEPATEVTLASMAEERVPTVSPFWTWVIRGSGAAVLLVFIAMYSFVHIEAIQESARTVRDVQRVKADVPRSTTPGPSYPQRPDAYRFFYMIESAVLNTPTDDYRPVRFAHRIHDGLTDGNCAACHHRYAGSEDDRVGVDIRELHTLMGIALGGTCSSCHDDMAANPPQSCARCHAFSNEPDDPARIGLKGAYHRQCIGCHEAQRNPAAAPTACNSCHHPWTPDHTNLVSLGSAPSPQDVTRNCLTCHTKTGQDLLKTAHWNWKGYSPNLVGYEHRMDVGLALMVNNYCLAIGSNLKQCASCHIGYGGVDAGFDFTNPDNLDCLVCHDTTGQYRKDPLEGGMPDPSVDLVAVAQKVGRPSRQTCGSCHFESGGAPNAKHGDLEPALAEVKTPLDVHMGEANMTCQRCHQTTEHRIAGRSMSAPAFEGEVTCERCHGSSPHGVAGMLSRHLDNHVRAVACETCHIPSFARSSPTLLSRDYSVAGQDRPEELDQHGMPVYDRRFGTMTWGKDVVPVYAWYNGKRNASLVGEAIDPSPPVVLNAPIGDRRDPLARIFPFKVNTTVQPYDTENSVLAVPDFVNTYWVDFDWEKAIAEGMKRVGVPYSGQFEFVETRMYSGIHHGVVPARQGLACADCHSAAAISCGRCHRTAAGQNLAAYQRPAYPKVTGRFDFGALGYTDDPAMVGGRFRTSIGPGLPTR